MNATTTAALKAVRPEAQGQTVTSGTASSRTATAPVPQPGAGRRAMRRRVRESPLLSLLGVVLLGFAFYAGYKWWAHARSWVTTDNAYVAAHIHTVSTRLPGTIQQVLVEENQNVAAGAVLARLDPRDFEVHRQQAEAQAAQAQAQLKQADAQVAQAQAQVARDQARATKARADLERAEALFHGSAGAISRQEYDQAKAEAGAAQAALKGSYSAEASAAASVAGAQAQEKAAQANLREAELQLSYAEILAPAAGRIGKKNLETGNRVQPGQALLALVQPEVWVSANFKETQLTRMKPGQAVVVHMDAFPGRIFRGRVQSLAPASGAQFALLPPDNATGNFTRIVQRVPVKITLETAESGDGARLVPGMSAVVEVNVRD